MPPKLAKGDLVYFESYHDDYLFCCESDVIVDISTYGYLVGEYRQLIKFSRAFNSMEELLKFVIAKEGCQEPYHYQSCYCYRGNRK